jgi:hypothetical protein
MRLFVTDDGKAGYAIHNGDELVSVFSSQGSNRGRALVQSAIAAGARRADCFSIPNEPDDAIGYLPALYRAGGLVEVARVEINPDYDPPEGATHVSILAVLDEPPAEVRWFGKNDYVAACAFRDGLLLGKAGGEDG